jgi:hypothetical protein
VTAVSPRGTAHYAPCLKGAVDPPDSVDPRSGTATITIIDGLVVDGTISPDLLSQVREFLGLNRQLDGCAGPVG